MKYEITRLDRSDDAAVERIQYLLDQLNPEANAGVSNQTLEDLIDDPNALALIAEDDENMQGILSMSVFKVPNGQAAWIEALVVDKDRRQRGIGKALMKAALTESSARRCKYVSLTARPNLEGAIHVYESLGFKKEETGFYEISLAD